MITRQDIRRTQRFAKETGYPEPVYSSDMRFRGYAFSNGAFQAVLAAGLPYCFGSLARKLERGLRRFLAYVRSSRLKGD